MRRAHAALLTMMASLAAAGGARAEGVTSFGDAPDALRLPEAVAVAPDGSVLVGDHFSGRIRRFRDGHVAGAFGLRGEGCGRLGAVGGLAAGRDGKVYVLDTDQQLVQVFGADGQVLRCFGGRGSGRGQFMTSSGAYAASTASGGIAVDDHAVYVADTGNDRVQRFTLTGADPRVLAAGRLSSPQGLAVRGTRLLVADDLNHRVVELTTAGRFVRATSPKTLRLRYPYDVVVAPSGRTFVADNNLHRIVVLDRRLHRVGAFGREGHGSGRFEYPRALALTSAGHVLVADAGNDRVTEHTARGGWVRAIGRSGRAAGLVTTPRDVAANGRGEVAVADGNARLSWFSLDGRRLGAWAQGRSFQQSTAVVHTPSAVGFAGDGVLRVADGTLREFAAGSLRMLGDATYVVSADAGPGGETVVLLGQGRWAALSADGTLGPALGSEPAQGRSVVAIARMADGGVALAEGTSPHQTSPPDGTILRYDAAGRLIATWPVPRPSGGAPSRPAGLAAGPDGELWVADAANDRLLRFTPGGAIDATLGAPGAGDGELAVPAGLAVDCAGGLLVADSGNDRIVRFAGAARATGCRTDDGRATPVAGTPPPPVGLTLRTEHRASRPAATLATVRATCRRTCTLRARAVASRKFRPLPLKARVDGRTITVTAPASTVRAMRRGGARASVTVDATSRDGVVDTVALSWAFGR